MTKEIKVNVAARKPLTKEQIDTSAVLKSMILTSMLCAEFGYIELINCGVLKRQDKNLARKEAKLIQPLLYPHIKKESPKKTEQAVYDKWRKKDREEFIMELRTKLKKLGIVR